MSSTSSNPYLSGALEPLEIAPKVALPVENNLLASGLDTEETLTNISFLCPKLVAAVDGNFLLSKTTRDTVNIPMLLNWFVNVELNPDLTPSIDHSKVILLPSSGS